VKKKGAKGCRIRYEAVHDYAKADEKRAFLQAKRLEQRQFEEIKPDKTNNWINQITNDFDLLIPVADKETKSARVPGQERAIFRLFTLGVVTNRDEWVYGFDSHEVARKVKHLIKVYHSDLERLAQDQKENVRVEDAIDYSIKWTRLVKTLLKKRANIAFEQSRLIMCSYRPYFRQCLYFSKQINEMQYRLDEFYCDSGLRNAPTIIWSDPTSQKPFMCVAVSGVYDLHFVGAASGAVGAAATIVSKDGHITDNITDWALEKFRGHYEQGKKLKRPIQKEAIFHYVYGVLYDPIYREKYAQNLKREFPRVPFYADFWRWAEWGEKLMALHIGYETVEPWLLERIDVPDEKSRKAGLAPKALLRANKDTGNIHLDSETQLTGVPLEAWTYRLGNRSALEWILDQYKEKTPKDPTIRENFNTYRFADHKEKVIDLLRRVTRVSIETMKIVEEMRAARGRDA
jgi:predicted helicase